jgi:hypothetical protein
MVCKILILLLLVVIPAFAQTAKRRVAVLDFEYGTVYNNVAAIFGSNTDVGKGIADLIVEKMVNGQTYSVVERKAIDKILAASRWQMETASPRAEERRCWVAVGRAGLPRPAVMT